MSSVTLIPMWPLVGFSYVESVLGTPETACAPALVSGRVASHGDSCTTVENWLVTSSDGRVCLYKWGTSRPRWAEHNQLPT